MHGNLPEVKLLLAEGAEVNARHKYGITALMLASNNGCLEVVQALLAEGAEVNTENRERHNGVERAPPRMVTVR